MLKSAFFLAVLTDRCRCFPMTSMYDVTVDVYENVKLCSMFDHVFKYYLDFKTFLDA